MNMWQRYKYAYNCTRQQITQTFHAPTFILWDTFTWILGSVYNCYEGKKTSHKISQSDSKRYFINVLLFKCSKARHTFYLEFKHHLTIDMYINWWKGRDLRWRCFEAFRTLARLGRWWHFEAGRNNSNQQTWYLWGGKCWCKSKAILCWLEILP